MSLNLNTNLFATIAFVSALGLLGFSIYKNTLPVFNAEPGQKTPDRSTTKLNLKESNHQNLLPENNLVEQISGWHLFGLKSAVKKTIPEERPPVEKRPQTKLNLTIKGIINDDQTGDGWAIIANASKKENHFKVGDKIFNMADLVEIHKDYIVLSRNGKQEELRIARKPVTFERVNDQQSTQPVENNVLNAFKNGHFDQYLSLLSYKEFYVENGNRFLGFQLSPLQPKADQLLQSLGLHANDIVTSINNTPLTRETDEESIATIISAEKLIRLKIIRNEKPLTINIPNPM